MNERSDTYYIDVENDYRNGSDRGSFSLKCAKRRNGNENESDLVLDLTRYDNLGDPIDLKKILSCGFLTPFN